jgi:hypothetical protein
LAVTGSVVADSAAVAIEVAETFGDHAVVLFLGRAAEREAEIARELESDSAEQARVRARL